MYNDMKTFLKELDTKGIPVHVECSRHSWQVLIDGEPAYICDSASDVTTFLCGMLIATIH